jgi:hypothetical protein
LYNVAKGLLPMLEVDDLTYSAAGVALVLVVFTMWLRARRERTGSRAPAKTFFDIGPRTDCE